MTLSTPTAVSTVHRSVARARGGVRGDGDRGKVRSRGSGATTRRGIVRGGDGLETRTRAARSESGERTTSFDETNGRKAAMENEEKRKREAMDIKTAAMTIRASEKIALGVKTTTNARGVRTVSLELVGAKPRDVIFHWGVKRGRDEWETLPTELHPPGTTAYGDGKAMRSAFPVWGALNLVLDPGVTAVSFALFLPKTNEWINASRGDFEISFGASEVVTAPVKTEPTMSEPVVTKEPTMTPTKRISSAPEDPVELLIADMAHTEWERMSRPSLDVDARDEMMKRAADAITSKLSSGLSLGQIRAEFDGKKMDAAPPRAEPVEVQEVFGDIVNKRASSDSLVKWTKEYDGGKIFVEARETRDRKLELHVIAQSKEDLIIHWGSTTVKDGTWKSPPDGFVTKPARSWASSGKSWETEFERVSRDVHAVTLEAPVKADAQEGITFALRTASNNWIKNGSQDFFASLDAWNLDRPKRKEEPKKERRERHESVKQVQSSSVEKQPKQEKPKVSVKPITRQQWNTDDIAIEQGVFQNLGGFVDDGAVSKICDAESGATRSLMHRYNAGADMLGEMHGKGEPGLVALFSWFRFMALRQLVWNNDYNIKPREISAAQARMTEGLSSIYRQNPEYRDIVRLIMATIGRGGDGDVGQRIRDEILAVQQKNNCKGGMMEEWHQKLHNNTSPDDVPICEALLKFIASDCDIKVYWDHLHANGIDAERMKSYDRQICSEPSFSRDQYEGLTHDLTEYLRTLKAVHSGADLDSAAEACLGYHQDACKGKEINIPPIHDVASDRLEELLNAARELRSEDPMLALESMIEARRYLWTWTRPNGKSNERIKDVIYLDLALEGAARSVVESSLESMHTRSPYDVLRIMSLVLENLCLSASGNQELRICLKEWQSVLEAARRQGDWALQAKAVCDRLQNSLGEISQRYIDALQPTAQSMGSKLGVDGHVLDVFSEEIIRGTAAAPLSQMIRVLDPVIRNVANMGSWQIVSNAACSGVVVSVNSLAEVQNVKYSQPTVIVADRVGGEEDVPVGVVAVITPDMPDVLSHCAVRARNEKVLFATIFDINVLEQMKGMAGKSVKLDPSSQGDDLRIQVVDGVISNSATPSKDVQSANIAIVKKPFQGRFVVTSSEFTPDLVGGKSRNLQLLRGRVSNLIKLPPSVALPFGTFDAVLDEPENAETKKQLQQLIGALEAYDSTDGDGFKSLIKDVKTCIKTLKPTANLSATLEQAFDTESLAWPGDLVTSANGQKAWQTILGVWASKYNERAVLSCKKASLNHGDLSMAVLCQPVVRAKYAFVLHTVNPQNNNEDEIYGELVCGLGEALVGNFSGRALSFKTSKKDLGKPTVVGYPSKSKGLFMETDTLIFRSDSNGEDLEGFAGAGLYDSITMEEATLKNVDYSTDNIITDESKRERLLSTISKVALEIETLLGSAQDIEGAIAEDGTLWVVQTRPQV